MACETREKMIDGRKILVEMFPARRAVRLEHYLLKLGIVSIAHLLGGVTPPKDNSNIILDSDIQFSGVSQGFEHFFKELPPEKMDTFFSDMLAFTTIDGKRFDWNVHDSEFAGRVHELYKILFFSLEVNFASFLESVKIGGNGLTTIIKSMVSSSIGDMMSTLAKNPDTNES